MLTLEHNNRYNTDTEQKTKIQKIATGGTSTTCHGRFFLLFNLIILEQSKHKVTEEQELDTKQSDSSETIHFTIFSSSCVWTSSSCVQCTFDVRAYFFHQTVSIASHSFIQHRYLCTNSARLVQRRWRWHVFYVWTITAWWRVVFSPVVVIVVPRRNENSLVSLLLWCRLCLWNLLNNISEISRTISQTHNDFRYSLSDVTRVAWIASAFFASSGSNLVCLHDLHASFANMARRADKRAKEVEKGKNSKRSKLLHQDKSDTRAKKFKIDNEAPEIAFGTALVGM